MPVPTEESFIDERTARRLIYALLMLGVGFRLFHFFNNRSFFIDELFLNVNLIKLNFWELATRSLEYEQKAPLGYLWAVRAFVEVLGKQEPVLRLFALLCGLGTLFMFVPVARLFLKPWGTVVAVGILALAYPAIYHSVEAKQYSTELFASVLALYLYTKFNSKTTLVALLAWGMLGGLLLWFSLSTIFILAGIGMAVCLKALIDKDRPRFFRYLIPGALWMLNFGLIYHFFVAKYKDSDWLSYFFKIKYEGFLPVRSPVAAAKWLLVKAYAFLSHPLGMLLEVDNSLNYFGFKHVLKMGWLYLPLIVIGTYFLFRANKQSFLVLAIPISLTLLASALSQYPFYQRFTLFLAPAIILLLAYGAQQLVSRYLRGQLFSCLLFFLLLAPSFANSARQVINPDTFYNREYYREAVFYVNDNFRPGDAVYVYWNMRQAYDYYRGAYGLRYTATKASYVKNQSTSQADYFKNLAPDFAAFQGKKRLWFIYDSNNRDAIGDFVDQPAWYHEKASPPGQLLDRYFTQIGKRVALYRRGYYKVALYELTTESPLVLPLPPQLGRHR